MHAVVGGRHALALLPLVVLPALEGATRIQHAPEEALLALDDLPVDAAALQPLGQLIGFVGHRAGAGHVASALELLQLIGERPLAGAELAELLADGGAPRHGKQAGALLAQPALLLGELGHPLERLGETGAGARPLYVPARPEKLVGGHIERVHRAARLLRAFPRVWRGVGDGLAGALHLLLRATQRGTDLGRHESVLARRLPDLVDQTLHPFLDRSLLRPQPAPGVAAVHELLLHRQLALGQAAGLRERLIDRRHHLLAPLLLHALPLLLELVAQRVE